MTGPALALVRAPDDDASEEFGHVLSGVMLAGDAMLLAAALDRDFLAGAGWNPEIRVLSMPAAHPLLGRRLCRTGGCTATAHGSGTGGLCYQCSSRLVRAGWAPEEIRSAGELPPLPARADGCLVPGCQRMSPGGRQGQRTGLCQAHSRRFRRVPGTTIEAFLADPRVRPLPPLGPCRVAACSRRSESEHGYCPTHYVRWRAAVAAAPGTDQERWDLACPAVAEPGRVSLRGLPPLVVVQVLAGIQYRAREQGAKITDVSLRAVCDGLRRQRAVSAVTADPEQITGKAARSLLRAFARRARLALADPAREQLADTWDLAVFGHPGGLSFTAITQPWLREAAKAWAAEELPRHRGGGAAKVREKISATVRLSESLRCRDDRGEDPQVLGRTDAEAFLNRLGYLESAGRISRYQRNVLCRGTRFVLTGIRALGLTRPGQPAAGLPGDFTVGAGDIPAGPVRGEPGGDLRGGGKNQLGAGLGPADPAEDRTAVCRHGHMPVPGKFSRVELLPRGSLGLEARLARVEPGLVDGEHLTGVGGLHGPDGNAASTAGRGRPVRWGVAGGLAEPGRGRGVVPHDEVGGGWEAVHASFVKPVVVSSPTPFDEHETHLGQHLEVLGHGGLADVRRAHDLAHGHGLLAACEQGNDLDPGRLGERAEPGRILHGGVPAQ